ncbi:MAG: glycosyltransferase family 2 protein [Bdellovibrionota bacterium]
MKLAIVIPFYNESSNVASVLDEWIGISAKYGGAIVAVNDGSKDDTLQQLKKLSAKFPQVHVVDKPNGGHGSAVLAGYRYAAKNESEFIFQVDGDGEVSAEGFEALWNQREKSDLVVGVRHFVRASLVRTVLTKLVVLLNLTLFRTHVRDSNCPFRLFRGNVLDTILEFLPDKMLVPNIHLTILFKSLGMRVNQVELQRSWLRPGSRTLTPLRLVRICIQSAAETWKLRKILRTNRSAMIESLERRSQERESHWKQSISL